MLMQLARIATRHRGASAVSDPYWANVVTLLNFPGANGSTTFTDATAKRVWTPSGDAKISTDLGYNAGKFDGSGDYLTTPISNDIDFGSGDFTMELWCVVNAVGSQHTFFDDRTSDTSAGLAFYVGAASRQVSVYSSGSIRGVAAGTVVAGQLFHAAYCVRQGIATAYFNGAGGTPVTLPAGFTFPCPAVPRIGSQWNGSNQLNGYIKAFRVTSGVARYNGTFTPPSAPFPTAA